MEATLCHPLRAKILTPDADNAHGVISEGENADEVESQSIGAVGMVARVSTPIEKVATKLAPLCSAPLGGPIQFFGSLASPPSAGIVACSASKDEMEGCLMGSDPTL